MRENERMRIWKNETLCLRDYERLEGRGKKKRETKKT